MQTLLNYKINLSWRKHSLSYMVFKGISDRIYAYSFLRILDFEGNRFDSHLDALWDSHPIITYLYSIGSGTFSGSYFVLQHPFRFFWNCFSCRIEDVAIPFYSHSNKFSGSSFFFSFSFLNHFYYIFVRTIYTSDFTYSVVFSNWNFLVGWKH